MAGQKFRVQIYILTECEELVSSHDVERWLGERFDGCDLGEVEVSYVIEDKTPACKVSKGNGEPK